MTKGTKATSQGFLERATWSPANASVCSRPFSAVASAAYWAIRMGFGILDVEMP